MKFYHILLALASAAAFYCMIKIVQAELFTETIFEPDCEYKLPSGYHLRSNGKYYSIYHQGEYLWYNVNRSRVDFMFPHIDEGLQFEDSCKIKAALKSMLEPKNYMQEYEPK